MSESSWRFIERGEYQQAVEAYTYAIQQDPLQAPHYANRAFAYLGMKAYGAAAQNWAEIVRLRPDIDDGYIGLGLCHWCLTSAGAAIETWKRGLGASYTDAAGGVQVPSLLLYAALRTGDQHLIKEGWQLLRRHARRKLTTWPGSIVPYLLGRLPEEALHAALEQAGQVPVLRERFRCQAAFYQGVRRLIEGKQEAFQEHMRACAESWYGYLEFEYYLAGWEVANQFPAINL